MAERNKIVSKASGGISVRMHLTILPQRLYISSLQKSFFPSCGYALMQLLLFEEPKRFFSLTETDDEISLILGENPFRVFKEIPDIDKHWEVCPTPWLAIQISEGSLGFTSMGIVHALSDPLAKAGISIFNISTSDTDFTLVPEDKIYDAIDCLEEEFTIMTEGLEELNSILPRPIKKINEKTDERIYKQHPLSLPPYHLFICAFRKEVAQDIASSVLTVMFFPQNKRRFFSYTESEDEISLVMDKEALSVFSSIPSPSGPWKPIKVDDGPLGFSETGIVCSLAETLTEVSLFYLSTFFTDYILVESPNFSKAIEILKREKFEVRE